MLTLEEIKDKLKQLDEVTLLETLGLTSEDLINRCADLIEENLDELADDVTTWINTNYEVLDYDKAKCYRDGNYLLDAISHDLNYGGNLASRWNADFYYWNNTARLPESQRLPTASAYKQLAEICRQVVLGDYPGQVIKGDVSNIGGMKAAKVLPG